MDCARLAPSLSFSYFPPHTSFALRLLSYRDPSHPFCTLHTLPLIPCNCSVYPLANPMLMTSALQISSCLCDYVIMSKRLSILFDKSPWLASMTMSMTSGSHAGNICSNVPLAAWFAALCARSISLWRDSRSKGVCDRIGPRYSGARVEDRRGVGCGVSRNPSLGKL